MTTSPPRSIDELYSLVSLAIHRAGAAEGTAAEAAHLEVSCLEEEIAELLTASDKQGAIARRGVLTAAIAARQYMRAVAMADAYLAEQGFSEALRAKLLALRETAQRAHSAGGQLRGRSPLPR